MSSNAFARSRPRVRHQRVPRNNSCDHPRFLQLVNELARINDAKNKQEDTDSGGGASSSDGNGGQCRRIENISAVSTSTNNNCAQSNTSSNISNNNITSGSHSGPHQAAACNTCCDSSGLQTSSNGYRSLDTINQSTTSALHDYYQHQNNQHHHNHQHQSQQHHHHHHHHHNSNHHSCHHGHHNSSNDTSSNSHHNHQHCHHNIHFHQESQNIGNNLQQHDERCPVKSSPSSNYNGLKLVSVEQNGSSNPSFPSSTNNTTNAAPSGCGSATTNSTPCYNNMSDLRQDENRSKRKRSANDSSANSRKSSSSSSSCGGGNGGATINSKRHKSTSDAIRPLSPSFSKCPICLLDCMDRDPSFTNTCFHLFCFSCIDNWTKNKATCPLCRTKFTKIIYGIKSATQYDEKLASPIRRDDDDGYIADRLMLEQLSGLNSSSQATGNRGANDDVQFLFENLRNSEVLMPQYFQVSPMENRQDGSIHTFNAVTAASNFNSNVPHSPFTTTSYPITQNYILFPPNRIPPTTSAAITSAYTSNTSLTNINSDPSRRRISISRSGRYSYPRNYELQPTVDGPTRVSRTSNIQTVSQNVSLERHHHHHHPHQHQHLHHNQHQHATHSRSLVDVVQSPRVEQGSHAHIQLQYPMQTRHYAPNPYPSRRPPYNNPQMEHHLLDTIYRQMPDM